MKRRSLISFALALLIAAPLALTMGCGQSKVTFISFQGKGKESVDKMKPIITNLKKKYKGKVIFIDVDMDSAKNKKMIKEYHVTMNPTYIVKNTKGEIKETFMGAAAEDMLNGAIASYIPEKQKPPSSATTSGMQPPTGPQPVPMPSSSTIQTIPGSAVQ